MFQRLNKIFVSEANSSSKQEPEFTEKEDDVWIFFSAEEEEEEEAISEESSTEHTLVFSCLPASLECLADTSASCFLQFESCPMEESRFITLAPCFTAGGLTTIKAETSPMENLLIKHSSMSVYVVYNSCPGLNESQGTEMEAQNELGQHIHCYVAALTAHATLLEQPKTFQLSQNSLCRQNLTRDCRSQQVKHNGCVVHQPCPSWYNY
uniref:Tumor protein p53-inducible nuclear protein 1 n=1 Tax=Nannospalax galili TaxID=1026970 RepID=A0A8C6RRX6_NANGA